LFAPVRVPAEVTGRLVPAFRRVVTAPEFIRRLKAIDTVPGYEDPATFKAQIARNLREWTEIAERLNLTVDG
jgi:tripartite-type tricarboxylate transporter receptor subunit TctC